MKDYETLVKDIIQEENELKDKIIRLEYFMMTEDYQKLSSHQKILLTKQLNAMNNYKGCLISRVMQIRLEHEEIKGCTCEPEPEEEHNCQTCKWCDNEFKCHSINAGHNCWTSKEAQLKREGPEEKGPNEDDCAGCRYFFDKTGECTNKNKKDGKCWEADF